MEAFEDDFLFTFEKFYERTGIMGKIAIKSLLLCLLCKLLELIICLISTSLFVYIYERSTYFYAILLGVFFISFIIATFKPKNNGKYKTNN